MSEYKYIAPDAVIKNSLLGDNVKIYKQAEVKNSRLGEFVSIGDGAIIRDSQINSNVAINRRNFVNNANVGSYSYTGIGTMVLSAKIGKFCSISWYVSIGGAEHEYKNVATSRLWRFHLLDSGVLMNDVENDSTTPLVIGNDVWIASNAVVLRDIRIGDGAVIGAGAVVTKDVAPYSIVAGVPARTINKRFDDKTIETLQELKWWDWPVEVIRDNLEFIFSSNVNAEVIQNLKEISNKISVK